MVAQRLVEVHRLQDRRVEAGEQLRGDDQDLERVGGIAEAVEQLLLGVPVTAVGRVLVLAAVHRHDDVRRLRRQVLVERLLVEHAALAVEGHDLRPEAARRHLLLEVPGDVGADLLDALGGLHEHGHLRGGLGELVPVEVAEAAGELLERLVDRVLVDVQLEQPRLEVERHRCAVADRLLEAVAAQVAGARPPRRRRRRRCCGRRG